VTDCNEILNETRPDVLEIHRNYFEAEADAVETKYVRLQSG
jgi:methionine synthase I (cobalamin-dependent)